ncbi:MAG: hypothetical protein AAFQ27_12190 [Pseudomonadota bacterium]
MAHLPRFAPGNSRNDRPDRVQYARRSRPPEFTPVKIRERADGWRPEVQCGFLAALYLTGSVTAAVREVGMSAKSAYRLRAREGATSFANAWDHVLRSETGKQDDRPSKRHEADWRKVTVSELIWRVEIGLWRPMIYRGKLRGIARKPDNSALLRLIRRLDRVTSGLKERPA